MALYGYSIVGFDGGCPGRLATRRPRQSCIHGGKRPRRASDLVNRGSQGRYMPYVGSENKLFTSPKTNGWEAGHTNNIVAVRRVGGVSISRNKQRLRNGVKAETAHPTVIFRPLSPRLQFQWRDARANGAYGDYHAPIATFCTTRMRISRKIDNLRLPNAASRQISIEVAEPQLRLPHF